MTDDRLPSSSTAAGGDRRLVAGIRKRLRREKRAEARLSGSSRWARGCSAVVSGSAAFLFGAVTVALVGAAFSGGIGGAAGTLAAAAVVGGITAGFGFLTWRWARGHNPSGPVPLVDPGEVKALAAKMAADEAERSDNP